MSILLKKSAKVESPIVSLIDMLQTKRPDQSKNVWHMIDDWIAPLGGETDSCGNHIIRVGDKSRVLWSSHTDTVHKTGGFQKIIVNGDLIKLAKNETSNCLGADCTTGVWIMREMILAKVPGLYVFHAGEECGGIGSQYLAKNTPKLFEGIDFAIAFDRRGKDSIITHQWGGRCASDKFVQSIAPMLPKGYIGDSTGTFTDTANYTGLIGECTNLSIGYEGAHSANETQSISHALALRDAMLRFDETKLVADRKAGEVDPDDLYDPWPYPYAYETKGGFDRYSAKEYYRLIDFIEDNPAAVADFLESYGITIDELENHAGGVRRR